jgi:hypothetical protein
MKMLTSNDMERLFTEPEVTGAATVPGDQPPPVEEQTGEAAGSELIALLDMVLGVSTGG